MKILALDSTAATASVAVTDGLKPLAVYSVNAENTHSEHLLPMIEHALGVLGMTACDIDIFACSAGPGSFTGVRIGVSTVKGLAFGTGKPCIAVSTLDALACNMLGFTGIIVPVMNARRGQVYTALFESDGVNRRRITPDMAISAGELALELERIGAGRNVYFTGDGFDIASAAYKGASVTPAALRCQSAYSVACVALEKYENGGTDADFSDAALVPTYLRASSAERERNERSERNA